MTLWDKWKCPKCKSISCEKEWAWELDEKNQQYLFKCPNCGALVNDEMQCFPGVEGGSKMITAEIRAHQRSKNKSIYLCVLTPYGILKTQSLSDNAETRQWFKDTAAALGLKLGKI